MPRHDVWFGHDKDTKLPICRVCLTEITSEIWIKNPPCPGSLDDHFALAIQKHLKGMATR